MSAIFGVWYKNQAPQAEVALFAMERAVLDWQCDQQGMLISECQGLGVRLRWTTPESRYERVPYTHPSFPHLSLAADAWLDDRKALCDIFEVPAGERATTCDSELILRAYDRWGDACVEKLRGDFAFALWDSNRQKWCCGRDYLGLKPFFYFDSPEFFCFASDIRAVLACPGVPAKLYDSMLAAYLVQNTYYAEKRYTFYQGVVKLPSAHALVIDRDNLHLTRYWSSEDAPAIRLPSKEAYTEQTHALLAQAVCNATRTSYPVGAHLSGGLDSTSVAILASREISTHGERMHAYSWSPAPSELAIQDAQDERTFIAAVCQQENIPLQYLSYTADDVTQIYTRDVTRIPHEMALREVQIEDLAQADQIRVMLSGWGGDEVISYSGRGYLAGLARQGHWRTMHRGIIERIPPTTASWKKPWGYVRIFNQFVFWPLAPDLFWKLELQRTQRLQYTEFIHPAFYQQQREQLQALHDPLGREYAQVRATQIFRLEHGHLTRRAESWATHGAKHGMVYRYPLLDRALVEFCLGLPPELYFGEGRSRAILRRATRGILPEDLRATRTKAEPTAINMVQQRLAQGAQSLFAQTLPLFDGHPAAQYVNVANLKKTMTSPLSLGRKVHFVLAALSCFYMTDLE